MMVKDHWEMVPLLVMENSRLVLMLLQENKLKTVFFGAKFNLIAD